jgi:SAM-dependent methyltransferase
MRSVTEDLADVPSTAAGRFVPQAIGGELREVESRARYAWAATFASGRRVLDVGCGLGDGISTLVDAGAERVAGVDIAEAIVEVARSRVPPSVELRAAQLHELPFEDQTFDLVLCLEALEHVAGAGLVLDELKRVLAGDGLVAASVPVEHPDVGAAMASRWRHVLVMEQQEVVATTLVEETTPPSGRARQPVALRARDDDPPVVPVRRLALAGDGLLPPAPSVVMVGSPFDVRRWRERFLRQQRVLEEQADYLTELQQRLSDRADLLARLAELEAALGDRNVLEAELEAADNSRRRLAEETGPDARGSQLAGGGARRAAPTLVGLGPARRDNR